MSNTEKLQEIAKIAQNCAGKYVVLGIDNTFNYLGTFPSLELAEFFIPVYQSKYDYFTKFEIVKL